MTIVLNGINTPIEPGTTIAMLLEARNLTPKQVAVEVNKRLLRTEHYDRPLEDGDEIEIVSFVGGG